MTHLEIELNKLKEELNEMWSLVLSQLKSADEALHNFDKGLAAEVVFKEKMVDVYDLKIDRDCEHIIALYNPVAVDLRLTIAVLKINADLERIADFARGIVRFVKKCKKPSLNPELLRVLDLKDAFDNAVNMLEGTQKAFNNENSRMAMATFAKDDFLDELHKKSVQIIGEYIKTHPEEIEDCLNIFSIMRKLERVGDHCNNIAEEIIFYLDAKVLKHGGLKEKKK